MAMLEGDTCISFT